jgi:hypothetical protein
MKMVVYKTTNIINNKIYVGKDARNSPSYLGSGKLLKEAIEKYGKENFVKEVLEVCDSPGMLARREQYWIRKLNSINPHIGYNLYASEKNQNSYERTAGARAREQNYRRIEEQQEIKNKKQVKRRTKQEHEQKQYNSPSIDGKTSYVIQTNNKKLRQTSTEKE